MFRRKTKSKTSFLVLHSSSRGSDIVRPNNTSLIVNESDSETEDLPKELSIFSEDEDDNLGSDVRKSSSLMKSLSQKTQSTPLMFSQKRMDENPGKEKYKSIKKATEKSYFEEVIRACGAVPLPENSSFKMSEDQAVFSLKVNDKLKENYENVKKFVDSVKEMVKNRGSLQKLLAHTLTDENCEIARGPIQEPLLRMLLNVDCLQSDLVELLLNVIADIVIDNKLESEHVQLVSSILQQMKFLSGLKDIKIADKLFEIIHIATLNVKKEIIFVFPEIIPEQETEEACNQLLNLLKYDEALTHVIIDALTHLPITKDVRSQVCMKILSRLDKCPIEFLPSLVQFVLTKSLVEDLYEVVNGLRNNLPFTPQHYLMRDSDNRSGKNSEDKSHIKLTFENLKFSVMASRELTEIWMKIISNLHSSTDFRCVDLIMLIIFYGCLFGRKSQILQLFRSKIKSSVLSETHVKNAFKILVVIAEEYCSPTLEVASALLKSFEPKVSSFGAVLYKECFINFHIYMKQIVISEILLHVGTGTPGAINTALNTMKELCKCEKESLSQHITSIMGLLIKVQDLELTQVRLLMDIVSELVFFQSCVGEGTAAQDELEIFIQKQLISSKPDHCKKGVSAAVMYGKHAGKQFSLESDNHLSINSLLEVAKGSQGTSDLKTGFFNDEFATMINECRLSKPFLEIWSKNILSLVMNNLFGKDVDSKCADFATSLQYSVGVEALVFPVVDLVVKSNDGVSLNVPVTVIPSTLRLLWCLEEDLNKILPAFYASIIMPEISVYDSFNTIDESQKKNIMDCLFLCGNYLIECINALCARGILNKAVLRIKQLIGVRKLIAEHIYLIPDYVPPLCQFYAHVQKVFTKKKTIEKKAKKGRKRKLESETSTSFLETQPTPGPSAVCSDEFVPGEPPAQEVDLHLYSSFFRELDFATHKLLDSNLTSINAGSPELDTCEILFLLEDLLYKSEQILKPAEVTFNLKSKPSGLIIQKVSPIDFITVSITILPQILRKVKLFSEYCENLLKSNDWIYDSQGLYVQGACHVKFAMAAGLKFIAEIISWREFQNSNSKLLRDFLLALTSKVNSSQETLTSLTSDAASILSGFSKTALILSGGISIVKSCEACLRYSSSESLRESLAHLCHEFLCRSWFTVSGAPERGPPYNQHVDCLLKTYFSSVEDKLETVRVTAKTVFDEMGELPGRDSTLKTFKTINKRNFPLLYRVMCEALVSASTNEFSKTRADDEKQLNIWNKIVETLLILVEMAKNHPSRVILAALLKRSQSIIQLFLGKGMPIVESALRVKSVKVLTLLKSFQMVTRFLHSICCHSRITNDSVVAAHVPAIRSQCERLTLEVKGMLILNGIPMDCITIAILKNRDIKGNDIISQETLDDSDDDSELPPEDTAEEQAEPELELGEFKESNTQSRGENEEQNEENIENGKNEQNTQNKQNEQNEENTETGNHEENVENKANDSRISFESKTSGRAVLKIEDRPPEKPKLCCSTRLLLSIFGFVAIFCVAYVRVNISMVMLCMVVPEGKSDRRGEFFWSSATKGLLMSAAFYGFLVGPFVGGFLSYKFGGKLIFVIGIIGTGVANCLAPEAARITPILFFIVRVATGFFAGLIIPSFYDLVTHWVVAEERQLLVAGVLVSIPVASIVTFPVTSATCDFLGWVWLFYMITIFMVIWGIISVFVVFDRPENCPFISEKERRFLEHRIPNLGKYKIPWKIILKSLPIHVYFFTHFCMNYVYLTIIFALPSLMKTVHHFQLQENGLLSATPFLGSFIVRLLLSLFFEQLRLKLKISKNALRKIFVFLGAVLVSLFLLISTFLSYAYRYWVLGCFILASSSLELCLTGGYLLSLLDLCPSYVNVLTGLANTVGNTAGLISPVVNGLLTPHGTREEWNAVFYVNITVLLTSMIFYLVFGQNDLLYWGLATIPSRTPVPRASLVY